VANPDVNNRAWRPRQLSATPSRCVAYAGALVAVAGAWLASCALAAQDSPAPQPASAVGDRPEVTSSGPVAAGLEELERLGETEGGASLARLREGTQLTDRLGRFRQNGEALSFIDEGGRELGGLPNLSLERITNALKAVEEPESVWWSVSGTVTEFGDRNYLLVTRAVYKAAALPPTPDAVE
jgi:hypothetical protein